jgi:trimethylamine:corrinoid methyltransferase-like protein
MWERSATKDVREKAASLAREMLKDHRISDPLDPDTDSKMADYIKSVLRKSGT